jgi:ATP-dependent DNA ligase
MSSASRSDDFLSDSAQTVCAHELEGVVAKRCTSRYRPR